jgi:hypothetical protein
MKVLARLPLLVLVVAIGCRTAARTEIVVDVDSNLGVPAELDRVAISVRLADQRVQALPEQSLRTRGAGLPLRVGLLAPKGHEGDQITVTARALGAAGQELASQLATVSFVAGRSLWLRLYLARECLGGGPCQAEGTTCTRGGSCVDVLRPSLPPFDPQHPAPLPDAGASGESDGGGNGAVDAGGSDRLSRDTAAPLDGPTLLPDAPVLVDGAPVPPDVRTSVEVALPDRGSPADVAADQGGHPPGGNVTIVVGDTGVFLPSDTMLLQRLAKLGFKVNVIDDGDASPADAIGRQLLVLAPSIGSQGDALDRIAKYQDSATPILCLAVHVCTSLKMTMSPGIDYSMSEPRADSISIELGTHPLAAGLSAGNVQIVAAKPGLDWFLFWMNPPSTAIRVATLPDRPTQVTIFAFERAARLSNDMPAPARRVGFTLVSNTYNGNYELNANGVALLDAAITWASQ